MSLRFANSNTGGQCLIAPAKFDLDFLPDMELLLDGFVFVIGPNGMSVDPPKSKD